MKGVILTTLLVFFGMPVHADKIELKLPTIGTYAYHHDLLKQALEAMGHQVTITSLAEDYPQKRLVAMLDSDSPKLTLYWLIQTKERDETYVSVDVGVTDGLIGRRILFIPKGRQAIYDGVNTLVMSLMCCFGFEI